MPVIDDEYCKLRCKLECLNRYEKEMVIRSERLDNNIQHLWESFFVVATKKSSWYYYNFDGESNIDDINNIGHRFWNTSNPIESIISVHKCYKMEMVMHKQEYEKFHKWYQLLKRYAITQKIETCKENIRLFYLLIKRYNNSESLTEKTEEKHCMEVEIKNLRKRIQTMQNKLNSKCKQYLESIQNASNR